GDARVFPPFQGNGGGPSGGPIMTLKGRAIDLFIHLTGVRPCSVLEVGDVFTLSGAVGPSPPAVVSSTVIKPDGTKVDFNGRANRVGYYYQPKDNFLVDQPGIWTVDVKVVFDGVTSAGQVVQPFPSGDILGTSSGRFTFYVVPRNSVLLAVDSPRSAFLPGAPLLDVRASLPGAVATERAQVTSMMPGFLLSSRDLTIGGGTFSHRHDPVTLSHDSPNLDVPGVNAPIPADVITMSLFAQGHAADGSPVYGARVVALHGNE